MLTVCKGSLPFVLLLAGEPAANVCSMYRVCANVCIWRCQFLSLISLQGVASGSARRVKTRRVERAACTRRTLSI